MIMVHFMEQPAPKTQKTEVHEKTEFNQSSKKGTGSATSATCNPVGTYNLRKLKKIKLVSKCEGILVIYFALLSLGLVLGRDPLYGRRIERSHQARFGNAMNLALDSDSLRKAKNKQKTKKLKL
jgi:hypothetical protein